MKTHKENFAPEKFVPAFDLGPAAGDDISALAQRLKDIARSADDLRRQLAEYEAAADNEELHACAEALRTWMDVNREGLSVAARAAELGLDWTAEMSSRLESAAGSLREAAATPGLPDGMDKGAQLTRVWKEINSVLDTMEALYKSPAHRAEIDKIVEPASFFAR